MDGTSIPVQSGLGSNCNGRATQCSTNIQNILSLVWFYGISTIVGYLMLNPLYTYILNIYGLVWFGLVLWHINHCRLFNAKYSLHIYIDIFMIWFGWVLWHINHCRLFRCQILFIHCISNIYDLVWLGFTGSIKSIVGFNAKSSLYIYIKYIWFGLVGFYGISTIVGYSPCQILWVDI